MTIKTLFESLKIKIQTFTELSLLKTLSIPSICGEALWHFLPSVAGIGQGYIVVSLHGHKVIACHRTMGETVLEKFQLIGDFQKWTGDLK